MTEFYVTVPLKREVKKLRADVGARYWEDATVNGVEDEDGSRIPCRDGDYWKPTIDLATGKIEGWPEGTTASIHYKSCDDNAFALIDEYGNVVAEKAGYVIKMMSPKDRGFGDYVIMDIGPDGVIADWKVDLSEFEPDED